MDMPRNEVRKPRFDRLFDSEISRARVASRRAGAITTTSSSSTSTRIITKTILQGGVFLHRQPGDPARGDGFDQARPGRSSMMSSQVGYQDIGGRITRHDRRRLEKTPPDTASRHHPDQAWMDAIGIDYACLFPTPMLFLGLHAAVEVEVAMARAYNRWLCERVLAEEPRISSMLYLPFNDPEATYQMVKDFGDKKGVVGFTVDSPHYKAVYDNAYMKTYALLEEMGIAARRSTAPSPGAGPEPCALQPLHRRACARLHAGSTCSIDQLALQRHAGALPQAQDHVGRKRACLGLRS